MPPKLHEAAAAPESSHSCCVGKYGNTTVQVMHNARHRPLLQACARRPPVRFSARLFHRVPGPCVQIAKRRGCAWAGGFLWCVCSTGMAQATHAARINTGIDIINTLAQQYGFLTPIFVDNAEAVTQLIETPAQVIRLVVSEADKTLRVDGAAPVVEGAAVAAAGQGGPGF